MLKRRLENVVVMEAGWLSHGAVLWTFGIGLKRGLCEPQMICYFTHLLSAGAGFPPSLMGVGEELVNFPVIDSPPIPRLPGSQNKRTSLLRTHVMGKKSPFYLHDSNKLPLSS